MSQSRLTKLWLRHFKSFKDEVQLELAPLTILLGRNNSGKSSLIQSLLLLKQTLAEPRPEVPLHLDGFVSAFSLRELTFGWPASDQLVEGPAIGMDWESTIDVPQALRVAKNPDALHLAKHTDIPWFEALKHFEDLPVTSQMNLYTREIAGVTSIGEIELTTSVADIDVLFKLTHEEGNWTCHWQDLPAKHITVELDHFIPYLRIDRGKVGPRDKQRAWHNAYLILFAQPLEDLKRLLSGLQYLSSTRTLPPSLFKASNVAPQDIGVSGEWAAQLLHRRQKEIVHYALPPEVGNSNGAFPDAVRESPLVDAVNEVLAALSIKELLTVQEVHEVGFRLLFGSASLPHVGRGLTYLLPLVELGLLSDPLRFKAVDNLNLEDYLAQCPDVSHIAIEEPEAHLHPKVQSRLAQWMVCLAMTNRRLIVETHSDHLVRRLRGLAARAGAGSPLEQWLLKNVIVCAVEQDPEGNSTVTTSHLTPQGGIEETWPADFMDEASEEDSAIFYAAIAKEDDLGEAPLVKVLHDEGPEPDLER